MKLGILALICLLGSCQYHVVNNSDAVTLGIPFIKGDKDGAFSKLLTQEIAVSGIGEFRSRDCRYEIHVSMNPENLERIGFRYDRKPDGQLKPNIIGTETRKTVSAQVEVYDLVYDRVVFGPKTFVGQVDFDYVDSDNIADMSFINPEGKRTLVFSYSLGQLNTIEGAQDSASPSVYRILSKKIADELALHFRAN